MQLPDPPQGLSAATGDNGNALTRGGKRKCLLLDAALDTDAREGMADPRQDRSKVCVGLRILISDQEILMCIHKNIPLWMRLK